MKGRGWRSELGKCHDVLVSGGCGYCVPDVFVYFRGSNLVKLQISDDSSPRPKISFSVSEAPTDT